MLVFIAGFLLGCIFAGVIALLAYADNITRENEMLKEKLNEQYK